MTSPKYVFVIRLLRTTLLFLFSNRFLRGGLLSRGLFCWSFLGGRFLLSWHWFSPLSTRNCENQ
jgi:hypothetical protein